MIKVNDIVRFKNSAIARSRFMTDVDSLTKSEKKRIKKLLFPICRKNQRVMRVIQVNDELGIGKKDIYKTCLGR